MKSISPLLMILSLVALCYCFTSLWAVKAEKDKVWGSKLVVKKDDRIKILETEFGEISVVKIGDGDRINGSFHLQFFKLEPNALFLPVMLHSEMLLYCHSGTSLQTSPLFTHYTKSQKTLARAVCVFVNLWYR